MHLTKQDYLRVLLPTRREVWVILAVVLAIFLVYEANLIFLKATNGSIFSSPQLVESFNNQIDAFFANNLIANKATLVIFWAGVGLVAYSIIWSVYSFISESKSEIEVATDFVNKENRKERLQRTLVQTGALVGIVVLGLLSVNLTVPYFVNLWTNGIVAIPAEWLVGLLQITAGFVGLCANLYLFKVLIDWIVALE